jgi:hypothetical protein
MHSLDQLGSDGMLTTLVTGPQVVSMASEILHLKGMRIDEVGALYAVASGKAIEDALNRLSEAFEPPSGYLEIAVSPKPTINVHGMRQW